MKTVLFLFLPILLYAQNPNYKDTVTVKSNRSFACLITELDESSVDILYMMDTPVSSNLGGIEKIFIDGKGIVYTSEKGFLINPDDLQDFLTGRYSALKFEKELSEIENRKSIEMEVQKSEDISEISKETEMEDIGNGNFNSNNNRWSFGFFYVPNYSAVVYRINIYQSNSPYLYQTTEDRTIIQSQFGYKIYPKLYLKFNLGYSTSYDKSRLEKNYTYKDSVNGYSTNQGNENIEGMKLLMFELGVKYYFTNLMNEKVSAFVNAGFGKQFAFVKYEDKNLYPSQNSNQVTSTNRDEFLEHINSPYHFDFGFGAEYFFNKSLSVFSSIQFYYTAVSGKYEYISKEKNSFYSTTQKEVTEYDESNLVTLIGLGLNFYF